MRPANSLRQALNLVANLAESRLQKPTVWSLPHHIDIVLTKACNLACTFCKDYETLGSRRVSVENFRSIAAQLFPTARLLSICSGGEPYLHPGLEDMLRIARSYRVNTWVLSNGTLLAENRIRAIVRENLVTLHGVSIDGIKAETVESMRVNAKLPTIIEGVRLLLRIRNKEGKQEPGIVIRYALMRSNIEELPEAVQFWGTLGVERLDCDYLSVSQGIDPRESLYHHQDLTAAIFLESKRVEKSFPRFRLNLPRLVEQERRRHLSSPQRCTAPWEFVKIDTDGHVQPCWHAWEALKMGNAYAEGVRFEDLWNSAGYQALRKTVNDDKTEKFFPYCARCESRFGWGELSAHMGDQTWLEAIRERDPGLAATIDHRRNKRPP